MFADSPTYGLWTSGRVGDQRVGGYQIRNNIFTGNRTGIYLRDGLRTVVSGNLFEKNGLIGDGNNLAAIYADDSANDGHVLRQRVPREQDGAIARARG